MQLVGHSGHESRTSLVWVFRRHNASEKCWCWCRYLWQPASVGSGISILEHSSSLPGGRLSAGVMKSVRTRNLTCKAIEVTYSLYVIIGLFPLLNIGLLQSSQFCLVLSLCTNEKEIRLEERESWTISFNNPELSYWSSAGKHPSESGRCVYAFSSTSNTDTFLSEDTSSSVSLEFLSSVSLRQSLSLAPNDGRQCRKFLGKD